MADTLSFDDTALAAITAFADHFGIKGHDLDRAVWAVEIDGDCRIALAMADQQSLVCAIGGQWFDAEHLPSLQTLAAANVPIFAATGGTFGLDDEDHVVYLRRLPLNGITGDALIYLVSEMLGALETWAEQWKDAQAEPPRDATETNKAAAPSDFLFRA